MTMQTKVVKITNLHRILHFKLRFQVCVAVVERPEYYSPCSQAREPSKVFKILHVWEFVCCLLPHAFSLVRTASMIMLTVN